MQIIEFASGTLRFLDNVPDRAPADGFVWIYLDRESLRGELPALQEAVQRLGGSALLDLHVQDLENAAHPSHYDYTSIYDLVVFRRLATAAEVDAELGAREAASGAAPAHDLATFHRLRTRAVAFGVFDRLLVTVHPSGCFTSRSFIERYLADAVQTDGVVMVNRSRLPASPADLMLRMINVMVDSYLELRKELSGEMDRWQQELLRPRSEGANWNALMTARAELHTLEDLCEGQNDAMQEWLDTAREQPSQTLTQTERDSLVARARDVIEHIQRVVHQVRRMEQAAETAVQIHFSAQSHRTNDIMRTLTALTAIFLPLNLVTGIFGMNFESMPWTRHAWGFWLALAVMAAVALVLGVVFWRKRYLARTGR
ncbi:MAG: magnesium transporter CorA family protein [Ramlibacter sp.]